MIEKEKKVKELDKLIDKHTKKIKVARDKVRKAEDNLEQVTKEVNNIITPLINERNKIEVDIWIERGKAGLNKGMESFSKNIPEVVRNTYYKIERELMRGCNSDPWDGCRGCSQKCSIVAEAKYNEMFGF